MYKQQTSVNKEGKKERKKEMKKSLEEEEEEEEKEKKSFCIQLKRRRNEKKKRKMKINTELTCWRKCSRKYPSNEKKKKKKIRKGKKRKEKKKKLPDLFSGILQGFFLQEVRVKSPSSRFYFRRPFRQ